MDIDGAKMKLFCAYCGKRHIDEGKYAKMPHRWHPCQSCGKKFWIPKPSIGVA